MAEKAPTSYKDPFWSNLSASTESRLGLPEGLLHSVVTQGERSNADQVSSAGAKTPYQITPTTRQLVIDKYGIDAYLSPENAAEAAGLLLKESLERNQGNAADAVSEYHGGTDRSNWGPITRAYTRRVIGAMPQSTFQRVMAEQEPEQPDVSISSIYDAYKSGQMTPDESAQFEADVRDGLVMLPQGAALAGEKPAELAGAQMPDAMTLPQEIADAYADGLLGEQERADLEADIREGIVKLPAPSRAAPVETETGAFVMPTEQGIIETPREPTIGERLRGAGETALALGTGATGGAVGMIGGTAKGLGQAIMDGSFGSQEAADMVERAAMEGAAALTYQPPSQTGQRYTQSIGELLSVLAPTAGLPGEMAQLAAGVRAAAPAARAVIGGIPGAVRQGGDDIAALIKNARAAAPDQPAAPSVAAAAPSATPEAAAQMAPEELGTLIRKASGSGIGSVKAQEKLAEAVKVNPEAKAAADRLGIDLPADVFSDSPQIRSAAGLTRSQAGSEAEAAWRTTVSNAINKADEAIQQFDAVFVEGAPSPGVASQRVLDSLGKTRSGLNADARKIYAQVDDAVPKQSPVALENVKRTIGEITAEVGKDGMTGQERRLLKMAEDGATYGRLIREKNLIGQAIAGKDSPYGNMDAAALKRLYASLAEDQLDNVGTIAGEPMRQQLRAANLMYAKERALGKRIISAFGKEADGSIANLMRNSIVASSKGDAAQFRKLLKVVPDDLKRETVATALASVARSSRAAEGGFGFAEFAKTYQGLRANTPVYSEIVKALGPEADSILRDLFSVSKRITEARANVLATGKANQGILNSMRAENLIGRIANSAMGKRAITGGASLFGPAAAAAAPDIIAALARGGKDATIAAGNLFKSPEFQKLAIEAATKETISPVVVRKVVFSPEFKKFAAAVRLPKAPKIQEQWLLQAIQGTAAEAPQSEQIEQ